MYGSKDPYPSKNVTDPEHCYPETVVFRSGAASPDREPVVSRPETSHIQIRNRSGCLWLGIAVELYLCELCLWLGIAVELYLCLWLGIAVELYLCLWLGIAVELNLWLLGKKIEESTAFVLYRGS